MPGLKAMRRALLRGVRRKAVPAPVSTATPAEAVREAALEARLAALVERRIEERLAETVDRTTSGRPNLGPLSVLLREINNMRWDIKILGAALAQSLYAPAAGNPVPAETAVLPLTSRLCQQADVEAPWFRFWAARLQMAPVYHRKVWESVFVLQALWEGGMLEPGRKGLGFAVGREPLPAFFASLGIDVLATDLDERDDRARAWSGSAQHAAGLDPLFHPGIVDRGRFDRHCRYRPVDMSEIPADLAGTFDFCWSMCSFEHLGTIEKGVAFVENAMRCLRPGGLAVHTTEFNLEPTGDTIETWPTVLFQRRHIDDLAMRLAACGHGVVPIDYAPGDGVLDGFVDLPPYPGTDGVSLTMPNAPHLRLSVDGFPCTSIGLIIRAAG